MKLAKQIQELLLSSFIAEELRNPQMQVLFTVNEVLKFLLHLQEAAAAGRGGWACWYINLAVVCLILRLWKTKSWNFLYLRSIFSSGPLGHLDPTHNYYC